mmetsp:Transcript_17205/g.16419  ORF Transcript_17205/g.16419 Transcript_17205/m.16419 type:complete len:218 (-) Transcript_17205:2-655(-)
MKLQSNLEHSRHCLLLGDEGLAVITPMVSVLAVIHAERNAAAAPTPEDTHHGTGCPSYPTSMRLGSGHTINVAVGALYPDWASTVHLDHSVLVVSQERLLMHLQLLGRVDNLLWGLEGRVVLLLDLAKGESEYSICSSSIVPVARDGLSIVGACEGEGRHTRILFGELDVSIRVGPLDCKGAPNIRPVPGNLGPFNPQVVKLKRILLSKLLKEATPI